MWCAQPVFSVSVVFLLFRVKSRRDDGVVEAFVCELARKEKSTDIASETQSHPGQKGFLGFCRLRILDDSRSAGGGATASGLTLHEGLDIHERGTLLQGLRREVVDILAAG